MALHLTPLDPAGHDREELISLLTRNVFPFHVRPQPTVDQVKDAINAGEWGDDETEALWVDDDVRGRVGVVRLDDLADPTVMIDLRLAEAHRGYGLGAAALAAATDRVFRERPVVIRFEGQTREDNVAMRRTFTRCGWVFEAHYRDGWPVAGGEPVASVAYSVLRRDWVSGTTTPVPWDHRVTLSGELRCADDAEAALVRAHLPMHLELTRAEPGCLSFEVDATDDPHVWRVAETFANEAAFEAHQRRTAASAWGTHTSGIARRYTTSARVWDADALVAAAWAAEEQLLDPSVRRNRTQVARLLADDVVEIGKSGRRLTRDAILSALEADPGGTTVVLDQRANRRVSTDTVLLEYLLTFDGRISRRSSLWRFSPDPRLVFHQGTAVRNASSSSAPAAVQETEDESELPAADL